MRKLILFVIPAILLLSCNDDFNINGPWKDVTVVYGLLNPSDTVQYLKINKAFLGDGDAWEMAKQADSVQYSGQLQVKLIELVLRNNNYNPTVAESWQKSGREIIFERTGEIGKSDTAPDGSPGTFGTQVNYLYKSAEKLTGGRKYQLQIIVPGKTDTITSETLIIYDLDVYQPLADVGNTKSYIDLSDSLKPYSTIWGMAVYGKVYQLKMRFNYIEILGSDTTWHSFETYYPTLVAQNMRLPSTQTTTKLSQKIGGPEFFMKVRSSIPIKAGVKRKAISLDLYYMVAGENYYTYRNVSSTQSGAGQFSTSYSNLVNAVGFFDTRYIYILANKQLKGTTHDELANGPYTKHLNFANGHGVWK